VPTRSAPASDLFGPAAPPEPTGTQTAARPLADRLRPRTLDEVVGQDHLLGPDGTLTRMLERGSLASLILGVRPASARPNPKR
jgi:putative ATPase